MNHLEDARALGFDDCAALDPATLHPLAEVRQMCAADKCGAFGKNWSCPPACGSLAQCAEVLAGFSHGILVQTVGHCTKTVDSRCYRETEARHNRNLRKLGQLLRGHHGQVLCLGAGGCRFCGKCRYPDPCPHPEERISGMEAYGLFVTGVCRDHGLPYHHGEGTITFTGCILYNP